MSNAWQESRPIKAMGAKLRNRRIRCGLMHDGSLWFRFKRLNEDRTIGQEQIRVSQEAFGAMIHLAQILCADQRNVKRRGRKVK